jgi:hypothetical protein
LRGPWSLVARSGSAQCAGARCEVPRA